MKRYILMLIILVSPVMAYAESIFLKSGAIIEGSIQKENDKEMTLHTADGTVMTIQRSDIIRIQLNTDYKIFKYIYSMDCTYLQGYIVDQKDDNYIIRKELESAEEFFIPVKDVDFISNEKIEFPNKKEDIFKSWYFHFGGQYAFAPGASGYEYEINNGLTGLFAGFSNSYSSWYHLGFTWNMSYLNCTDGSSKDSQQHHYIISGGLNYVLFNRIVLEPVVGLGTTCYQYYETINSHSKTEFCFTAMAGLNFPVRLYRGNCIYLSCEYILPFDKQDKVNGALILSAGFSF